MHQEDNHCPTNMLATAVANKALDHLTLLGPTKTQTESNGTTTYTEPIPDAQRQNIVLATRASLSAGRKFVPNVLDRFLTALLQAAAPPPAPDAAVTSLAAALREIHSRLEKDHGLFWGHVVPKYDGPYDDDWNPTAEIQWTKPRPRRAPQPPLRPNTKPWKRRLGE